MKTIKEIIEEIAALHPYKNPTDSDSYSDYNQGWADACDLIESRIESITP